MQKQELETSNYSCRLTTESMISYLWVWNGKRWSFHFLSFPWNYSHSYSHENSLVISILVGIPWDPWEFPT